MRRKHLKVSKKVCSLILALCMVVTISGPVYGNADTSVSKAVGPEDEGQLVSSIGINEAQGDKVGTSSTGERALWGNTLNGGVLDLEARGFTGGQILTPSTGYNDLSYRVTTLTVVGDPDKVYYDTWIESPAGLNLTLTLENVNIVAPAGKPAVDNARTLILKGSSSLQGGDGAPGLHVPRNTKTVISEAEGEAGSLAVYGGNDAPGIGGSSVRNGLGYGEHAGNVTINSGHVTAYGGYNAPGVGGGYGGGGAYVMVYGGVLEAYGGGTCYGIGGGIDPSLDSGFMTGGSLYRGEGVDNSSIIGTLQPDIPVRVAEESDDDQVRFTGMDNYAVGEGLSRVTYAGYNNLGKSLMSGGFQLQYNGLRTNLRGEAYGYQTQRSEARASVTAIDGPYYVDFSSMAMSPIGDANGATLARRFRTASNDVLLHPLLQEKDPVYDLNFILWKDGEAIEKTAADVSIGERVDLNDLFSGDIPAGYHIKGYSRMGAVYKWDDGELTAYGAEIIGDKLVVQGIELLLEPTTYKLGTKLYDGASERDTVYGYYSEGDPVVREDFFPEPQREYNYYVYELHEFETVRMSQDLLEALVKTDSDRTYLEQRGRAHFEAEMVRVYPDAVFTFEGADVPVGTIVRLTGTDAEGNEQVRYSRVVDGKAVFAALAYGDNTYWQMHLIGAGKDLQITKMSRGRTNYPNQTSMSNLYSMDQIVTVTDTPSASGTLRDAVLKFTGDNVAGAAYTLICTATSGSDAAKSYSGIVREDGTAFIKDMPRSSTTWHVLLHKDGYYHEIPLNSQGQVSYSGFYHNIYGDEANMVEIEDNLLPVSGWASIAIDAPGVPDGTTILAAGSGDMREEVFETAELVDGKAWLSVPTGKNYVLRLYNDDCGFNILDGDTFDVPEDQSNIRHHMEVRVFPGQEGWSLPDYIKEMPSFELPTLPQVSEVKLLDRDEILLSENQADFGGGNLTIEISGSNLDSAERIKVKLGSSSLTSKYYTVEAENAERCSAVIEIPVNQTTDEREFEIDVFVNGMQVDKTIHMTQKGRSHALPEIDNIWIYPELVPANGGLVRVTMNGRNLNSPLDELYIEDGLILNESGWWTLGPVSIEASEDGKTASASVYVEENNQDSDQRRHLYLQLNGDNLNAIEYWIAGKPEGVHVHGMEYYNEHGGTELDHQGGDIYAAAFIELFYNYEEDPDFEEGEWEFVLTELRPNDSEYQLGREEGEERDRKHPEIDGGDFDIHLRESFYIDENEEDYDKIYIIELRKGDYSIAQMDFVKPAKKETDEKQNQEPLEIAAFNESGEPYALEYGQSPVDVMVTGGSGSGELTLSLEGDEAELSENGILTIVDVGTVKLTALKQGDEEYNEVQTSVTVTIEKGRTFIDELPETVGEIYAETPLSSITLEGGRGVNISGGSAAGLFVWADSGNSSDIEEGENTFDVIFKPYDTAKYLESEPKELSFEAQLRPQDKLAAPEFETRPADVTAVPYDEVVLISIRGESGAVIYYTLDGSEPDEGNPAAILYDETFEVDSAMADKNRIAIVKAKVYKGDMESSEVAQITIFFEEPGEEIKTYLLTVEAGTGGTASIYGGEAAAYFEAGSSVSITATPDSSYKFNGWTSSSGSFLDNSNPQTIYTMPEGNAAITAEFSYVGGGSSGGSGGSGSIRQNGTNNGSQSDRSIPSINQEAGDDRTVVVDTALESTTSNGKAVSTITDEQIKKITQLISDNIKSSGEAVKFVFDAAVQNENVQGNDAAVTAFNIEITGKNLKDILTSMENQNAVPEFVIRTDIADIHLSEELLKSILTAASSDLEKFITINAFLAGHDEPIWEKADLLSTLSSGEEALVFEISVGVGDNPVNLNGTAEVRKIAVTMPYTPPDKIEGDLKNYSVKMYAINGSGEEETVSSQYDAKESQVTFEADVSKSNALVWEAAVPFTDTLDHWADKYISFAYKNDLLSGVSEQEFAPQLTTTRGMLVTVLGRMAQADTAKYDGSVFSDVSGGQYYAPYIAWAEGEGIISGIGGGMFAPDAEISREDLAVILKRYGDLMSLDLHGQSGVNESEFADSDKISPYAEEAAAALFTAGVITGREDGRFDPQGKGTRAETAVMLYKFIQAVK